MDFANTICEKLGQNYENKFVKCREDGKMYANVSGMNFEILLESGVPTENIDLSNHCTCCNTEIFYSHRGQKGNRGAMMNLICK